MGLIGAGGVTEQAVLFKPLIRSFIKSVFIEHVLFANIEDQR